jgi:hypothetical protein
MNIRELAAVIGEPLDGLRLAAQPACVRGPSS